MQLIAPFTHRQPSTLLLPVTLAAAPRAFTQVCVHAAQGLCE